MTCPPARWGSCTGVRQGTHPQSAFAFAPCPLRLSLGTPCGGLAPPWPQGVLVAIRCRGDADAPGGLVFPSANGFSARRGGSQCWWLGLHRAGGCQGGTLACTVVCSPCSLPEHRNTIFKISPGFAQHPAVGRRIPAKKKGRFPASKPTIPSALARSRWSFASCWGPSRGSVSPRPCPRPCGLPALQRGSLCGCPVLWLLGLFTALFSAAFKSQASSSCK